MNPEGGENPGGKKAPANPASFKARIETEAEVRAMEELIRSSQRQTGMRYKNILLELKSGDDIRIMEAVSNLSTELSIAQEDQMSGFPLEALLDELIKCLRRDGIPDIIRNDSHTCDLNYLLLSAQPCIDQSHIGYKSWVSTAIGP